MTVKQWPEVVHAFERIARIKGLSCVKMRGAALNRELPVYRDSYTNDCFQFYQDALKHVLKSRS